ncbi:hypothetical protein DID80_03000 [Candidatus Marinamargulisbacteria bacterium SCGC AAA071-K20]|nr:hypothetical protein DID80_03000 [Candidatus Marinamargulisbacteria bacterium SCGC AAA071-K20]
MVKVSVLGCGWLGLELAKALVSENYQVKGSLQDETNFNLLTANTIAPFKLQLTPNQSLPINIKEFLNSEILIVTLPFRRHFDPPMLYLNQIESLLPAIKSSPISRLLFTSSTSIYPPLSGTYTEGSEINSFTDRSQILYEVEQAFRDLPNVNTTICRLGGLYGGNRKLGNFLSSKKNLKRGYDLVNLVHRMDVVQIMIKLIKDRRNTPIVNCVSDKHPTRKELYESKAASLGVPLPTFDENDTIVKKIVSNDLLKSLFNYEFIYKDPLND